MHQGEEAVVVVYALLQYTMESPGLLIPGPALRNQYMLVVHCQCTSSELFHLK